MFKIYKNNRRCINPEEAMYDQCRDCGEECQLHKRTGGFGIIFIVLLTILIDMAIILII